MARISGRLTTLNVAHMRKPGLHADGVAEAALGHVVGDKLETAYRRGDFFEKRRRLMEAWGGFATTSPNAAVILPLRDKIN